MKSTLALSLTSAHLLAEVRRPPARAGFARLRSLPVANGISPVSAALEQAPRIELAVEMKPDALHFSLEEAVSRLRTTYEGPLKGLDLEVRLGMAHARIGLMTLDDMTATSLTSTARETYIAAWIPQMLHLDPQTQVVRWQILSDAHKVLISCVDRAVFDELQDFSHLHGLRFMSCRPAVLSAIEHGESAVGKSNATEPWTVVWTEAGAGARRSSSVQLLRLRGRQLWATWRGWIPFSPHDDDTALEGAIRRFQVHHSAPACESLKRQHWPSLATDERPA